MTEPIKRIVELEMQGKEYGFYWPDSASIMKQIYSECDEVNELLVDSNSSKEMLREEIGDLLHAVISLCTFYEFNPYEILGKSADKFKTRFDFTKKFSLEDGNQDLHNKKVDEMMKYWNKAKIASKEIK